jgi:hypothetical protein
MTNADYAQHRMGWFEMSCFTGDYVTGQVSAEYLAWVEATVATH